MFKKWFEDVQTPKDQFANLTPAQAAPQGWMWLHRGISGNMQLYQGQDKAEHQKLSQQVHAYVQNNGPVGLQAQPFYKRYMQLDRLAKDQNFAEIYKDALNYARKNNGQVFSILLPRQVAARYYAGSPTLRTVGGAVFHIPPNDLAKLSNYYKTYQYRPKINPGV